MFRFIFSCLLLFAILAQAQDYQVINYDAENGLNDITPVDINQDQLGFIWIASDLGLVRFDGINFKLFDKGLPSNYVKGLFMRKNKQLLAITDMGVVEIVSKIDTAYFNTMLEGSVTYTEGDSKLLYPKTAFETTDNSLWFCGGLSIYNYKNKKLRTYLFDEKNKTSTYYRTFSLIEDSMGNIFAFSQQGYIHKYDAKSDKFVELKNSERLPLINGVVCTQFGEILIATEDGIHVFKYDKYLNYEVKTLLLGINFSSIAVNKNHTVFAGSQFNGLFELYKINLSYQFENIPNMPLKAINDIFFDKDDNIWISTDAGIILLSPAFFASNIRGLRQIQVNDIKNDLENKIYLSIGNSAYRLFLENNRLRSDLILNKSNAIIFQLMPMRKKTLFSSSGELEWFGGKRIKIPNIYNRNIFLIRKDKFENIWLCTSNIEGVRKLLPNSEIIEYNSKFGNLTNSIISLAEDSDGTLYCGASNDTAYLFKYDRNPDVFKNVSIPIKFEHNKLFYINDIDVSGKSIYLASSDGLFLIENDTISRVPIKGFETNNAKFVKTDKNNNLWVGYENGVIKYNKSHTILFDKKDGLPSNTVIHRNILVDSNNNIFIGTNSGLAYSFKNNDAERITPSPIITSIKFNGTDSSKITSVLEGSYANIQFVSLSYPGKYIKYQTKILELDTCWSNESYTNELFIPKLKKGTYTLYVRALQHGNFLWSQPIIYSFIVKSNWYNRWWAFAIYLILSGLLVYSIVILNSKRLQKDKERLEQIIDQRTSEVVQQNKEMLIQKNKIELQATKLQNQNSKLKELSEFKQGMSSMIVHDLKNPLNLILNVPKSFDTPTKDKVIQQSGKQMLNMVLNILDVDKYQDMKMTLNKEDKQFVLIAKNAIQQVQFLGEQKGILINNQIDQLTFAKVEEEIIERVLVNMLTNAIKYTPSNGSVTLRSNQISGTFVRIEIEDTGEGIPKDKIHLVFQKFGQVVAKKSGVVRSTGLGLTFCKLAVDAHGGEIGVSSEEGKGTIFWFTVEKGTSQKVVTEIIEEENPKEEETLVFTEEEILILVPIINQLRAFTIYESDDVAEIIDQLKPLASENIQKWLTGISKNLITLNQEKYLNLLKIE